MSNLVYDGLYFQNELSAKWKLTNVLLPMSGETQEIGFGIFNNANAGFELVDQTPYGVLPNFVLRQKNDTTQTDLLRFDGALDQFLVLKPLNVIEPTEEAHATSKIYVDTLFSTYTPPPMPISLVGDISGTGTTGADITTTFNKTLNQITNAGDVDIANFKVTNLAPPTDGTNATNKNYVDTKTWATSAITDFSTAVTAFRLDQFAVPTADVSFNSYKITNVATPVLSTDGVNRGFIDAYTFDINTRTTGNLNLNRLFGYPNNNALYLRGDGIWSAPQGSGDVVGPAGATSSAIPTFSDSSGKVLKNNNVRIESDGRISNVTNPVFNNDAATKAYADGVQTALNAFKQNFRTGTIYVGDVGGGSSSPSVTGSISSAFKQDSPYADGDSFIDFYFANLGYTPLVFLTWFDATNSSACNDIETIAVQSVTASSARLYLEESSSVLQNGYLYVLLINPSL